MNVNNGVFHLSLSAHKLKLLVKQVSKKNNTLRKKKTSVSASACKDEEFVLVFVRVSTHPFKVTFSCSMPLFFIRVTEEINIKKL